MMVLEETLLISACIVSSNRLMPIQPLFILVLMFKTALSEFRTILLKSNDLFGHGL